MKIDLSQIDETMFTVNPHLIAGETCYLVGPQNMGCSWTQENKIFRSSVWNADGELISAGFPKFVNWGEKPEVFPLPQSLKNAVVVEKLDGSLLIVSRYKGEYIIRTRGTVDASKMEQNGHEIELFRNTILPKIELPMSPTWDFSILFEWTSPLNRIVIDYGEVPQFKVVGRITHAGYSLWTQSALDNWCEAVGLERPETVTFTSIEDLLASVDAWKGREGVCVYSKDGQVIHKVKSCSYLLLHRFKSQATYENTVDLFFEFGMPSYVEFQEKLISHFDYECFTMVQGFASTICEAYKEVLKIVESMTEFKNMVSQPSSNGGVPFTPGRKVQAQQILEAYGNTNRAAFVFTLLDGKSLSKDQLKKLLYQVTKK